jgi:DNA polymerase
MMECNQSDSLRRIRAILEFVRLSGVDYLLPSDSTAAHSDSSSESAFITLESIRERLGDCTRCPLYKGRRNLVFGEGHPHAALMFVGEGPGADEDVQGRPFVGRAGALLTKMIEAMGLFRNDVYIANVVKCRPPGNRDPSPIERETCAPFLYAQIRAVSPTCIVALGRVAAHTLLGTAEPMSRLRGSFGDWEGIPVMPTYHPSFLLRNEGDRRWKRAAWTDLRMVMGVLEAAKAGPEGKQ